MRIGMRAQGHVHPPRASCASTSNPPSPPASPIHPLVSFVIYTFCFLSGVVCTVASNCKRGMNLNISIRAEILYCAESCAKSPRDKSESNALESPPELSRDDIELSASLSLSLSFSVCARQLTLERNAFFTEKCIRLLPLIPPLPRRCQNDRICPSSPDDAIWKCKRFGFQHRRLFVGIKSSG